MANRAALHANHANKDKKLEYEVDSKCPNVHPCDMCYISHMDYKGKPVEKSVDTIVDELNFFNSEGYATFIITRDILNRNGWDKIMKASGQKHVLTTGIPLQKDPSMYSELKNVGIEQIVLSANLPELRCELNIPDYDITREVSAKAKENKLSVMICIVVNSKNYTRVKDMTELAMELGADTLRFMKYVPFCKKENALTNEQLDQFLIDSYKLQDSGVIPKEKLYLSREAMMSSPCHRKGYNCELGKGQLFLARDNYFYPCHFLVKPELALGEFADKQVKLYGNSRQIFDKLLSMNPNRCAAAEYHLCR
jgi:MoaA/NifB/PqqE/SkfB family radical SAM enzyme